MSGSSQGAPHGRFEGVVINAGGSPVETALVVTGGISTDTISASGAQTFTGNLAVAGSATIAGALNSKREVIDTGGVYATPIALTEAQSGRCLLVDDAAGLAFTLPAVGTSQIGTWYEFLVTVTVTSNLFSVTAASGDLLRGAIYMSDFDTASTGAYFAADESNDLIFGLNGSTTGGKKGTRVRFTAIHATGWFVDGHVFGDGTLATPFS